MAVTAASFKSHYTEFAAVPDAVVASKVVDATTLITVDIYAEKLDYAVELHVAQALALMPEGRAMRLASDESKTVYDERLELLRAVVSCGFRVV